MQRFDEVVKVILRYDLIRSFIGMLISFFLVDSNYGQ